MKIGDKVRFLSESGGGKVAGFQGKNIVLVEDEDGFQIPTPINEVVVVSTDDYSTKSMIERKAEAKERLAEETSQGRGQRSVKALMREGQDEAVDMSVEDMVDDSKEITYKPKVEERKGGNKLSAYLCFVPMDMTQVTNPRFEVYFVNDSNYTMHYALMQAEGNSWTLTAHAEVEPNMKLYIDEIGRDEINRLNRIAVQLIAWKADKPFTIKPAIDVELRIDAVKFYKVHTFQDNQFFENPALIYTIVKDDEVARSLNVDAKTLKKEMYRSASEAGGSGRQTTVMASAVENKAGNGMRTAEGNRREQLVGRYSDDQRKGNKRNSPYIHHRGLDDAIVVDLHADALLDTTAGMKPGEILDYQLKVFRDTLADYAGNRGQKIIFIHGKGAGVLRNSIIHELRYKYKTYTYQDASFQEYGYGATLVTIKL